MENGPNSIWDTSDKSTYYKGKRPISNTSLFLLPTKRTWNYTATLKPKYITTVNNINRRKERKRRRRLENKLSNVFITEEEDNMQDAYI